MAHEAGINQIAMRVAEVIHRYAESKGWSKEDYHILMKFNTDYFILDVFLVAKALQGRTERQETHDYDDVMDAIRTKAKPELQAVNYLGLVLKGLDDFDLYWSPKLKPSEIEIDEKLINHGVSCADPSLPAAR
jgi:hypothetical protein